ncbi:MAG TPA: SDR family oxidoreductase [Acidimicrobiales bacterium]|nr:SDR family oxidoreductase [Acidimicrobiales bacterium]
MTLFDAFRYDGKRVLVVGGATGMGAAAAQLAQDAGAEVVVMDFAEVTLAGAKAIHVNLADRPSIDTAIGECGGKVDVLMSCAGVADGTPGIERINFIGHRYMIDQLMAAGMLGRGSAIGFISSAAGLGWEANLPEIQELLAIPDFDGAVAWVEAHGKADYMSTKQFMCAYVASQAFPFLKQGIRINAICPGPTDTPLAQANKDMWLGFGADYRGELGIEPSTPLEQAYPLVFLCSDAAAAITGITMVTDAGYMSSGITGSFPGATAIANMLLFR